MGQFTLDLSRFAAKVNLNADTVVKKVALDMTSRIVQRTPVDTGRARGSWVAGLYSVPGDLPETLDASGAGAIAKASGTIKGLKAGIDFYMVSNLAYMPILEYGRDDGTPGSQQAPQGMVRVTVVEYQNYIDKAVRSLP